MRKRENSTVTKEEAREKTPTSERERRMELALSLSTRAARATDCNRRDTLSFYWDKAWWVEAEEKRLQK